MLEKYWTSEDYPIQNSWLHIIWKEMFYNPQKNYGAEWNTFISQIDASELLKAS